ncbi:MAG TPA: histidine phosphatase family protein [Ilumatobacteraceae bacterium]|nr:histidine phosphatase family protein [Ilumatobacteraceae bacterium]
MTRLYLVRHGRATAGWSVDPDPGLDEVGERQAREVSERLSPIGPLPIVTSPFQRCRATAVPLALRWHVEARVVDAVGEIPSPEGIEMAGRVNWLRVAMSGTWSDLGARYVAYRDRFVATLVALAGDTVVFSHFVGINAAIGAAVGDDRLVLRSLDNCSVTVVDVVASALQLVESGHEADTLIR